MFIQVLRREDVSCA